MKRGRPKFAARDLEHENDLLGPVVHPASTISLSPLYMVGNLGVVISRMGRESERLVPVVCIIFGAGCIRQVELVRAVLLNDVLLTTFAGVDSISIRLSENKSSPVEMERSCLVLLPLGSDTFSTEDSDEVRDERVDIREDDRATVGDVRGFFVGEA
jgi:hypothetical protein